MNLRRIIIEEINKCIINEENYNYHIDRFGNGINGYGEPYASENRNFKNHETGHFGSGTYFSTYKGIEDWRKIDTNKYDNINGNGESFIKIDDNVYRVDFDFYKNLYKPKTKDEAQILYDTLKLIDAMFSHIEEENDNINVDFDFIYYEIYQNIKKLELNLPSLKQLVKLMIDYSKSDNIQSFGTYFMELNGYNGVDVSGIYGFDNTKHGSVIYDLSKTSMEKVNFNKTKMNNIENSDLFDEVLKNGVTEKNYYKLKKLSFNTLKKLIKQYMLTNNLQIDIESIIKLEETFNGITSFVLSLFNKHIPYDVENDLINTQIISDIYENCSTDCFNIIIKDNETLLSYTVKILFNVISEYENDKINIIIYSWMSEVINNVIPMLNRKPTQYEQKLFNKLLAILNNIKTNNSEENKVLTNMIKLINDFIQ